VTAKVSWFGESSSKKKVRNKHFLLTCAMQF